MNHTAGLSRPVSQTSSTPSAARQLLSFDQPVDLASAAHHRQRRVVFVTIAVLLWIRRDFRQWTGSVQGLARALQFQQLPRVMMAADQESVPHHIITKSLPNPVGS